MCIECKISATPEEAMAYSITRAYQVLHFKARVEEQRNELEKEAIRGLARDFAFNGLLYMGAVSVSPACRLDAVPAEPVKEIRKKPESKIIPFPTVQKEVNTTKEEVRYV